MNTAFSPHTKWLEENSKSIEWKLIGPNLKNQFDLNVSGEKLQEYADDAEALKRVCKVQAIMGDTPVLSIIELNKLQCETDHPYLNGILAEDLRNYLDDSGIWDQISADFRELQESCRLELVERKR